MSDSIKKKLLESKFEEIMELLEIPVSSDNIDTPKRLAKMYADQVFANVNADTSELDAVMTTFKSTSNNVVTIKNIPFHSMCSHHWLPFSGFATIEYTPNDTILGLSKFPRVVKFFSKKPQVQEELTEEIGDYLVYLLNPKSLTVTLHDVRHTCVSVRGVETECEVDTHFNYSQPQDILSLIGDNLFRR